MLTVSDSAHAMLTLHCTGLVPAYTAAAFAKKMARLALFSPPAGAMTAIAFIHNLLRRHPSCMVLLDRASAAGKSAGEEAVLVVAMIIMMVMPLSSW